MRAVEARPTTVACPPPNATREPTVALPPIARTTPAGDATSSVPRCFATTTTRKPAAPPAAGQSAATAAAAATSTKNPLSFTIEPLSCCVPAAARFGFEDREALAGENLRAGELPAEPHE